MNLAIGVCFFLAGGVLLPDLDDQGTPGAAAWQPVFARGAADLSQLNKRATGSAPSMGPGTNPGGSSRPAHAPGHAPMGYGGYGGYGAYRGYPQGNASRGVSSMAHDAHVADRGWRKPDDASATNRWQSSWWIRFRGPQALYGRWNEWWNGWWDGKRVRATHGRAVRIADVPRS